MELVEDIELDAIVEAITPRTDATTSTDSHSPAKAKRSVLTLNSSDPNPKTKPRAPHLNLISASDSSTLSSSKLDKEEKDIEIRIPTFQTPEKDKNKIYEPDEQAIMESPQIQINDSIVGAKGKSLSSIPIPGFEEAVKKENDIATQNRLKLKNNRLQTTLSVDEDGREKRREKYRKLVHQESVNSTNPFMLSVRTPRREISEHSPRKQEINHQLFTSSHSGKSPAQEHGSFTSRLFSQFVVDCEATDPNPEEIKKHSHSSRKGGYAMEGDDDIHIAQKDEFNEGFVIPIKTSILDDKSNRPKQLIKVVVAILLFLIVTSSALLLSIGFTGFYNSNKAICRPNTFIDALSVDFSNSTCDYCDGSVVDIQTFVTIGKVCNPLMAPGYRAVVFAQSASPRITKNSKGYVAGVSNITKPLPKNVSEDLIFPVCVGKGGTVVLVVCLMRMGVYENIKRGDSIDLKDPLDEYCAALGVFTSTPCGGIEWEIDPIALKNYSNNLVKYPQTCDNHTHWSYNSSSPDDVEQCNNMTETPVKQKFKIVELIFGGLFFCFILMSNVDLAMRMQPILFKGFAFRPRPSPENAIDCMQTNKGHLGIVTPAISEEHVVIFNTICSVILSMMVVEKYNSKLPIDYFLVTGRRVVSPYFEMLVQIASVIGDDRENNKFERKAFSHMAKFVSKNQPKFIKHKSWQALKTAIQEPLEEYISKEMLKVDKRVIQIMRNMVEIEWREKKWSEFQINGDSSWKTLFVQKRSFVFYCMTLGDTKSGNEGVLKAVSLNAVKRLFLQYIEAEEGETSHSYILVVDSRHAPDPEKFYIGMLLREFYEFSKYSQYVVRRDHNVLMAQAPQYFNMPTNEPDLLGINGSFFFSVINVLRGLTGKVTSSGAHSIWVMSRYWGNKKYLTDPFPEKPFSLTEDLHGTLALWPNFWAFESEWFRPSVIHSIGSSRYVPHIVSKATPKSFKDFLKAYTRWGIGAIQLCPKYSLFTFVPFFYIITVGSAVGMILPIMLGWLGTHLWVNILFSVCPIALLTVLFIYFSWTSEAFQSKCVQWISTSNWISATLNGIFWPNALPLFFALGYSLPFQAYWFGSFALIKSFFELVGYEITKSVVNKLTKNCGLKDDNEYMRNFLTFLSLWPLNLYSFAHVLTYPDEWTPNPIPTLTKFFLAQTALQLGIIILSIINIIKAGTSYFSPAIISLLISAGYFFMMGPYFIFFFFLNSKKVRFGVFTAKKNKGILFHIYSLYTKLLLMVPITYVIFLFSLAVFLYTFIGTDWSNV